MLFVTHELIDFLNESILKFNLRPSHGSQLSVCLIYENHLILMLQQVTNILIQKLTLLEFHNHVGITYLIDYTPHIFTTASIFEIRWEVLQKLS